jgi:hypothetical protein
MLKNNDGIWEQKVWKEEQIVGNLIWQEKLLLFQDKDRLLELFSNQGYFWKVEDYTLPGKC